VSQFRLLTKLRQYFRGLGDRVRASPVAHRLLRGAFWSTAGALVSRGLGLLSWILVGRIVGKTGFGELGLMQATIGLFGTVAGFGMGLAATKFVAQYRNSDPARAGRIIALGSITAWILGVALSAALFVFADKIALHAMAAPQLGTAVRIGSLQLLFGAVGSAQSGALSGFEAFRSAYRINLFSGLASFPLLLIGAWYGGVIGATWALGLIAALVCLLNWRVLRSCARNHGIVISYRDAWSERGVLWTFNLPAVLNGLASGFSLWAVSAMLARQPDGLGELGIYNAAMRIKQVPEILLAVLVAPMIPMLSDAFGRNDTDSFSATLRMGFFICLAVVVPVSLIQIGAPWLTLLPFGAEFAGGAGTVQWQMLSAIVLALMWPMGMVFISVGRAWLALLIGLLHSSIVVATTYFMVPLFLSQGAAAAAAISMVVANLPCLVILYREYPSLMRQIAWAKQLFLTVTLVAICYALHASLEPVFALIISIIIAAALATKMCFSILVTHRTSKLQ
jgi:O-antigen/teichoic acid export membrane protein